MDIFVKVRPDLLNTFVKHDVACLNLFPNIHHYRGPGSSVVCYLTTHPYISPILTLILSTWRISWAP